MMSKDLIGILLRNLSMQNVLPMYIVNCGVKSLHPSKRQVQSQLTYSQYQQCARLSFYARALSNKPGASQSTDDEGPIRKTSRSKNSRYVVDEKTAASLSTAILESRAGPKSPVIHIDAGTGLVCRKLLEQGVSTVIALEATNRYTEEHAAIQKEFGEERFQWVPWPMLNLRLKLRGSGPQRDGAGKAAQLYGQSEIHLLNLLQKWPGSGVSIFNIGAKAKNEHFDFLFYILRNMPNDDPILSQPGVEFYFLAHPRIKAKLEFLRDIETAESSQRYYSILVMAYLLYDIRFVGEFDAGAFDPAFNSLKAVQDPSWVDPTKRLLIKLSLKEDIDRLLPLDQHINFLMFLRQVYTKKTKRTILAMEMLVPGCGLRMISLGFTMMDIILRTKPEKLLILYKHLIHWPEYQMSPLRNFIMQKTRGGLDHSMDEDGKGENW